MSRGCALCSTSPSDGEIFSLLVASVSSSDAACRVPRAQSRQSEVLPAGPNAGHQGRCDQRVVLHLELQEPLEAAVHIQAKLCGICASKEQRKN